MDKNVQYILEVAKCGGITKAANNLYITPSALSKFVQAREEELNVQLFHRIGKRFVLTAAGEYYVGRCKEIETIQKEITIQMERFSSMSHGMIRIGAEIPVLPFAHPHHQQKSFLQSHHKTSGSAD